MDRYNFDQSIIEIWHEIDKLHLNYLDIEEGIKKIELRSNLEDLIKNYLSISSPKQKFCNSVTLEIFKRSVNGKNNFSGYKAATGWNALQIYAGNLVMQPWRKEFRQIRKYSGFYKHHLEANLKGVELFFEAIGYKSIGENTLLLDGPIEPDKVISISKDCLIAYVECQIMKYIYEELYNSNVNVTWRDIFDFRRNSNFDPVHSVKVLKFYMQQKNFNQDGMESHSTFNHNLISGTNYFPYTFQSMPNNPYVMSAPTLPPYLLGSNGTCHNCYAYAQMPYAQLSQTVSCGHGMVKPQMNTNGYYYQNGYVPHIATCSYNNYSVPTGQLIDFDNPHNTYDEVDKGNNLKNEKCLDDFYKNGSSTNSINEHKNSERSGEGTGEDWDYVYQTLNDQGYTKDLGARGDVIGGKSKVMEKNKPKEGKKSKVSDVLEGISNLTVKSNKSDKAKKLSPDVSPASSYDNLSNNGMCKKAKSKSKIKEKSEKSTTTLTVKNVKSKKEETAKLKKNSKKWQCQHCTFLNLDSADICEMCSKSKSNIDQPIEVGGSECENCTLVNPKDVKTCQACDESLKNSPTYI